MRQGAHLTEHLVRTLLLLALAAAPLRAEEPPDLPVDAAGTESESVPAPDERHVETLEQKGGSIGYRAVTREENAGRAVPYGYLHSSASGGLFYRRMDADSNIEVDGAYLNRNDFNGDLLLDYRGDYRLHLRTEGLYHNLDRELLFTPDFTLGTNPITDPVTHVVTPTAPTHYVPVQDADQHYGVSVEQDLAQFRYRLHNFPLHLSVGYWRLVREGTVQQRFADASFEAASAAGPTQNTIYARPRGIDQRTDEVTAGLDSHLGPLDLIYTFKYRQFEDHAGIPVDSYSPRISLSGATAFSGGTLQHNEDPDSRLFSHTVKVHTSLTGGVVATGSYSLEHRENLSRLTDTTGQKHTSVDVQQGAGDVIYTPCKEFSLAVKYRHQELEHDNPSSISNAFFTTPVEVRPGIDWTREQVTATMSFRPTRTATINAEYRGDFLTRDNVSTVPSAVSFALPEHTDTHRGSLALLYRPRKGARLSAKYSYATTDHPSYGASFGERHEGEVLASYAGGSRWGVTAGFRERHDTNDQEARFLINYPLDPISYTPTAALSRSRENRSVNLAAWAAPWARTTVSANYSYLENSVDQGVFFTGVGVASQALANYFNRAHVYGVNGTYAVSRDLDLQLMLQQVRSRAAFRPESATFSTGTTDGVRELTEQDTVISTVSARAEQRFGERVSGSLEYTLNDYHENKAAFSGYNGTAHTVAAYLSAKW